MCQFNPCNVFFNLADKTLFNRFMTIFKWDEVSVCCYCLNVGTIIGPDCTGILLSAVGTGTLGLLNWVHSPAMFLTIAIAGQAMDGTGGALSLATTIPLMTSTAASSGNTGSIISWAEALLRLAENGSLPKNINIGSHRGPIKGTKVIGMGVDYRGRI